MNVIYFLRGLPGSGKSTWAKDKMLVQDCTRVSKDDLRKMMHNGEYSPANERVILEARDAVIGAALRQGEDVIVDDTNLASRHLKTVQQIADAFDAKIEIVDFTDVPIRDCIERDRKRPRDSRVGEAVIRQMAKRHLSVLFPTP